MSGNSFSSLCFARNFGPVKSQIFIQDSFFSFLLDLGTKVAKLVAADPDQARLDGDKTLRAGDWRVLLPSRIEYNIASSSPEK